VAQDIRLKLNMSLKAQWDCDMESK